MDVVALKKSDGRRSTRCARAGAPRETIRMRVLAFLVVSAVWATVPLWAHHWITAQYDSNKVVTLAGTVTKMEWTNPHAHFYLDVKDRSGRVINWEFEMGSPNGLHHLGWSPKTLKPGDHVTVTAYLARDRPHAGNARSLILGGGRKISASASEDGLPSP
jgi:hypothetical protein